MSNQVAPQSVLRSGGCLCGSVRFEARGEPLRTLVCHCRFCQRVTGSSSFAESMYPMDAVSLSGITPSSYAHRSEGSSQLVHVHFCPRCGSTVSLTFERWPQVRGLSRGAFDDPNSVSIGSHIWSGAGCAPSFKSCIGPNLSINIGCSCNICICFF